MGSECVRAEGVWKAYDGDEPVLRGLDLAVFPGEIYGLLGPNGSGKSTAIHVLVGLLPADQGHIRITGRPLSRAVRRRVGYVPQEPALYPRLTCLETLRFFGRVHGLTSSELDARVEATITSTGLEPYRTTRAEALSGGWRQRLSVAAAIVHDPTLLVLDEPTTGLDVDVRYALWDLFDSLARGGTSVLLASHSLEETETHCHRVGILDGGRIGAEGSPEELTPLVPARAIAEIGVDEPEGLVERGEAHAWDVRRRGGRWLRYLSDEPSLTSLALELEGLPVRSLSVRGVSLEDVFLEVTGAHGRARSRGSVKPPGRSRTRGDVPSGAARDHGRPRGGAEG